MAFILTRTIFVWPHFGRIPAPRDPILHARPEKLLSRMPIGRVHWFSSLFDVNLTSTSGIQFALSLDFVAVIIIVDASGTSAIRIRRLRTSDTLAGLQQCCRRWREMDNDIKVGNILRYHLTSSSNRSSGDVSASIRLTCR